MNDKKIIYSVISMLLLSAVFLSWAETKQADSNLGKNWWALSFIDPKSNDVSFALENHSSNNKFHYIVSDAAGKIAEGDVKVGKGETKDIHLENIDSSGKIRVDVASDPSTGSGQDKKEIYKNF